MKKFFKSLALVLALTLVFGSVNTFAATAPKLATKASKILFLDGAKGSVTAEDGTVTASPKLAKFVVKVSNAKAADVTVASADEKIAKVAEGTTRTIVPVAIGTTTLTVSVKGKEVGTIKVTVKKNAEEVKIDAPDTVAAGEAFTVTLPRKGVDTDERALACDSKDVTIEDANGYGTKYTVTAAKVGEITLKACAFQSATYTDVLKTAEAKVKVVSKAVSAVQKSEYDIALTCTGDASGIKLADVKAYTLLADGTTKMDVAVKAVSAKDDVATVTFFAPMTKGTTYYVVVGGVTLDVTAATLTDDQAEKIVIKTETAVKDKATEIKYEVVDANGIVIKGFSAPITFTVADANKADAFISGKDITIWSGLGKAVTVNAKATVWYTDAAGKLVSKDVLGSTVITSVAAPQNVFAGLDWTISNDVVDFTAWNYKQNSTVPAGTTDYKLVAQINSTLEGEKNEPVRVNDTTDYIFESANTSALIVDKFTGALLPVGANTTAQVLVKGATEANKTFVQVITVTIGPKKAIVGIEVKLDKEAVNTKASTDKATISVKSVNNYDEKVVVKPNVTLVRSNLAAASESAIKINYDGNDAVIDSTLDAVAVFKVEYTVPGTTTKFSEMKQITFATKASDKVNNYSVSAQNPNNNYSNEIDTTISATADTSEMIANISVAAKADAYWVANKETKAYNTCMNSDGTIASGVTGGTIAVQVIYDGNDVTKDVLSADGAKFSAATVTTGAISKVKAGTYNVIVYEFQRDNLDAKTVIGTTTIVVKDSQPALTATLVNNAKTDKTAFEVKYKNAVVTDVTLVTRNIGDNTTQQIVDKITYNVAAASGYFTVEVAGPWVIAR